MKLLWLLILPMFLFSQNRSFSSSLFTATSDSITNTTSQDTVDWVVWPSGGSLPAYTAITDYITAAEKAAGVSLIYAISSETGWTHGDYLKLRIRGTGTKNSITSKTFAISSLNGAITAFIVPDTTTGVTAYTGSKITGN